MLIQKLIILGVSADIGMEVARLAIQEGIEVIGTYRSTSPALEEIRSFSGVDLFQCDLLNDQEIKDFASFVDSQGFRWDCLFSSVGTTEPIGRFFNLDFDAWQDSFSLNVLAQLRALHSLYPSRNQNEIASVGLLAGGGTNNPFRAYSAYASAKIALIKMCELLDDEADDLNVFILGPGFVKTKTHFETLRAGDAAEGNLSRVRDFMDSDTEGTPIEDIFECLKWCVRAGRQVIGGRNLSIVHDNWGTVELEATLRSDGDMFKLRRHRNN